MVERDRRAQTLLLSPVVVVVAVERDARTLLSLMFT